MSGNDTPCHGCENRHKGCHASCDDYFAYAEEREKARAAMRAERKPSNVGRDAYINKVAMHKKKWGGYDG